MEPKKAPFGLRSVSPSPGSAPRPDARAELRSDVGETLERARQSALRENTPRGNTVELGSILRDVVDQVGDIARDSVALGGLEARRIVAEGRAQVADLGPRVAWGLVAAVLGSVGAILLVIAAFIGAGAIIPSVAVRLAIVGAIFGIVAGYGAYRATKRKQPPGDRPAPVVKEFVDVKRGAVAPIHPGAGVGE